MVKLKMLLPPREQCIYTNSYCEENVWKFCEYVKQHRYDELQHCYVVFISNTSRAIPIWNQKARKGPDQPVVWDYHVIFLHCPVNSPAKVYDLDTLLPFPYSLIKYLQDAIQSDDVLKVQYHRKFRVIPAAVFLKTFASDRSHMKNKDGHWLKPPPLYPCISTKESSMNLDSFISMERGCGEGQVMDLATFSRHFT